ncbi:hypothetical protein K8I31_00710, partial [bacterium]|nr:hypothetical protein [bacterium]
PKAQAPAPKEKPEVKEEPPEEKTASPIEAKAAAMNLSDDENAMFRALTEDAIQIDALCRELDWPIARVSSALGLLELKGLADREAGMRFRKADG